MNVVLAMTKGFESVRDNKFMNKVHSDTLDLT